ncbi:MAG: hypothetical protein JXJ04_09165 [Spirochaetales bacterium]|nr:hypothetical protein [Spirochaetales bacterium]
MKKDLSDSPEVKLAVIGDTATQLLSTAIKGYAYAEDINLDVFDADYNQLDEQLFDRNSEVYSFDPKYILLFMSSHALYYQFCKLDIDDKLRFADFQHWLKQLKERGVLLAVCSKNEEKIAKEPFEAHPDMVLRLEDISIFVAN